MDSSLSEVMGSFDIFDAGRESRALNKRNSSSTVPRNDP